jgi:proprotein convertase subtilisin/kexin type 5
LDINGRDDDPTPVPRGDHEKNSHGTRCAGVVAATAGNEHCGVGIAFNASIGGIRMLDGTITDLVEATGLAFNQVQSI